MSAYVAGYGSVPYDKVLDRVPQWDVMSGHGEGEGKRGVKNLVLMASVPSLQMVVSGGRVWTHPTGTPPSSGKAGVSLEWRAAHAGAVHCFVPRQFSVHFPELSPAVVLSTDTLTLQTQCNKLHQGRAE
ncbi:hypothetical protein FB451DRAFT_1190200 [Mycena latifolia]|nr:hypothetical protein FB451DRAFT_1190200 [Mycena latifolia]